MQLGVINTWGPLHLKWGVGAKWGRNGAMFTPTELAFTLGFLRLCEFCWKSIKKCERESARRRTHGHRQTGFIMCPMLHAITMGQIKKAQLPRSDNATLYVSWGLLNCWTTARNITFKKACSRWMTLKVNQGHRNCCCSMGHILLYISGLY